MLKWEATRYTAKESCFIFDQHCLTYGLLWFSCLAISDVTFVFIEWCRSLKCSTVISRGNGHCMIHLLKEKLNVLRKCGSLISSQEIMMRTISLWIMYGDELSLACRSEAAGAWICERIFLLNPFFNFNMYRYMVTWLVILYTFISYLPNLSAMTPTLKEPTMPPTLKMATVMLQTMVQTPWLIGSL